jgi:hypothetical protein
MMTHVGGGIDFHLMIKIITPARSLPNREKGPNWTRLSWMKFYFLYGDRSQERWKETDIY